MVDFISAFLFIELATKKICVKMVCIYPNITIVVCDVIKQMFAVACAADR